MLPMRPVLYGAPGSSLATGPRLAISVSRRIDLGRRPSAAPAPVRRHRLLHLPGPCPRQSALGASGADGPATAGSSHNGAEAPAAPPAPPASRRPLAWAAHTLLGGHHSKEMLVRLLPMTALFFAMSFNNAVLDSVKDTIVVTSGGAGSLPFLSIIVLPASFVFLGGFAAASARFSRARVFQMVVIPFLLFFVFFAFVLYPNQHAMRWSTAWLPAAVLPGLGSAVNLISNWSYTLFFVVAELWGDVVLASLFWMLAHEITPTALAPTLYPLMGIGANVSQGLAGWVTRHVALSTRSHHVADPWGEQMQLLIALVGIFGAVIVVMHEYITRTFPPIDAPAPPTPPAPAAADADVGAGWNPLADGLESLRLLQRMPDLACVAAGAMCLGITSNLLEVAWKSHVHMLYPGPSAYAAFMGLVSGVMAVVTTLLMVVTQALFQNVGWLPVAAAAPRVLLVGGGLFFSAALALNWSTGGPSGLLHAAGGAVAAAGATPAWSRAALTQLVAGGALVWVCFKATRFGCLKPAEEMVYRVLDRASKTRGKAAVDFVGSQSGKALGSILTQALLFLNSGSLLAALPFMFVAFQAVNLAWNSAMVRLGDILSAKTAAAAGGSAGAAAPHDVGAGGEEDDVDRTKSPAWWRGCYSSESGSDGPAGVARFASAAGGPIPAVLPLTLPAQA